MYTCQELVAPASRVPVLVFGEAHLR